MHYNAIAIVFLLNIALILALFVFSFLYSNLLHDSYMCVCRSFVEDRRGKHVLATYCKNPRGCAGILLLADDAVYSEACCSLCSTTFCAACDLPPHAPATCDMVCTIVLLYYVYVCVYEWFLSHAIL